MATIDVKCPTCGGTNVVKNGKSSNGVQRFRCMSEECTRNTFILEYVYNGRKPGIEEAIINMAANASGVRDTARVLGVSQDKVISTLKKLRYPSVQSIITI
jgi:transposase-like protein